MQAMVQIDVEDLEIDATPEDLMLSYVSGEKGKVGLLLTVNASPCLPTDIARLLVLHECCIMVSHVQRLLPKSV